MELCWWERGTSDVLYFTSSVLLRSNMAAAWFLWLVSGTVLVSMVMVGVACLCCRRKRPQGE